MVGAGAVIAQGFRGVTAHEDRTGVADLWQVLVGIFHRQLEVLGRDAVGHVDGLGHVGDLDQRAAPLDGGAGDLGTLQGRQQALDALGHAVEEGCVRADQDRLRILIVLGLGEQVHGDPVRVGLAVADDEDFRRSGDHVDADLAEHVALGGGDVDVARTDDLVHRRYALGTVGQRSHGLGAADGEDPIDSGDAGSGQHQLVDLTARGRHHHDHLGHAGNLRRNRVHQHRGRIGGLAARHIKTGTIQWCDLLAEDGAVGLGVGPGILFLLLVVAAHALGSHLQRPALLGADALQGQLQTLARQDQIGHGSDFKPVETPGQLHQRRIATLAHGLDDLQHALVDPIVGYAFPAQQMVQMPGEIGIGSVESANSDGSGHSGPHGWLERYFRRPLA